MRMQSHLKTPRRTAKQDRAQDRIRQMLAITEQLICDQGLDAVTMTEIASVAGMSIGALYQYFPNKDALASALRTAYGLEMDRLWTNFLAQQDQLSLQDFSNAIVDLMTGFIASHPAYLVLFASGVKGQRTRAQSDALRLRFAAAFAQRSQTLGKEEAAHVAQIAVAMVKSLIGVHAQGTAADKPVLEAEMKVALFAYLSARLDC